MCMCIIQIPTTNLLGTAMLNKFGNFLLLKMDDGAYIGIIIGAVILVFILGWFGVNVYMYFANPGYYQFTWYGGLRDIKKNK